MRPRRCRQSIPHQLHIKLHHAAPALCSATAPLGTAHSATALLPTSPLSHAGPPSHYRVRSPLPQCATTELCRARLVLSCAVAAPRRPRSLLPPVSPPSGGTAHRSTSILLQLSRPFRFSPLCCGICTVLGTLNELDISFLFGLFATETKRRRDLDEIDFIPCIVYEIASALKRPSVRYASECLFQAYSCPRPFSHR